MTSADPVWERFVACKLSQAPSFVSQTSENNSILGARSVNLTSGSIALNADAGTAGLMRDLAVKPVEEILSGKASQELASRNRYVRLIFSEFEWRLYYRTEWYPCWPTVGIFLPSRLLILMCRAVRTVGRRFPSPSPSSWLPVPILTCSQVDFVRLVLSCCVADAPGREKKAAVVVKALQVRAYLVHAFAYCC